MDEVQNQVRELLWDWHRHKHKGSKHGAFQRFWEAIKTDCDISHKKVLDELRRDGRVSWDLLARAVGVCGPDDDYEDRLEHFAGLWQEHRGVAPPGYCGRIVIAGQVVRDALVTPADARDDKSRIAMLEREHDRAQLELVDQHRRIKELQGQIAGLTANLQHQAEEAEADRRRLINSIENVSEQMRQDVARQHQEGAELNARIDRLVRENADLIAHQEVLTRARDQAEHRAGRLVTERDRAETRAGQLAQERDDAEARASQHLVALGELRQSTDQERFRLYEMINDLREKVSALSDNRNEQSKRARPIRVMEEDDPFGWGRGGAPPVLK
ncbi:hypothetical protein MCAG_02283 [Micromonospora sp. ATCC 39149]|uniref:Uncharacterized protein n=1 Tax=Micromonospora carbonacea TaxID=47853 RepID=A0A7D6CEY6_9ACTN|nr:hypothetical protein [Micromonospora sp. ATCC 39149]EEP71956.1 hypothetical protein MCAG_02283 [Micromonospora sp. ATCC 39149]QLJ98168.1 hypothetical protein HZU44_26165 [Micromonospora carbonacea]